MLVLGRVDVWEDVVQLNSWMILMTIRLVPLIILCQDVDFGVAHVVFFAKKTHRRLVGVQDGSLPIVIL